MAKTNANSATQVVIVTFIETPRVVVVVATQGLRRRFIRPAHRLLS